MSILSTNIAYNVIMKEAFKKAILGFFAMSPLLLGVIGLVGLMQVYVTPEMIKSLFGYDNFSDTLIATFIGGISVGQSMISYVIAGELQEQGVSLFATTAFILSWVTLGVVQLPAEASVFGLKFTILRNLLALFGTIIVAYLTVLTLGVLG